jgi:tetratricopeptide (TPR) repeat protein
MKQGQYYQAISAYDQASIYNSKDPENMAGKSLALFGAGQYVSSALFLSRAIELSPNYLNKKVDLFAAMGDKNRFETRIAKAEDWAEKSGAHELEFLLAYVHYRNGKLELANKAITIAAKKMPESKAVKMLKEAIEAAPKSGKRK